MPRLDRSVVHDELVLGLVLSTSADLDRALNKGEGMLNLLEVHITFHIQFGNFALLNLIKIDF